MKGLIFLFFCSSLMAAGEPQLPPGIGIPVLLFHGITEKEERIPFTLSKTQLRQHLAAFKLAGYVAVSIDDLYSYYYKQKSLPAKAFMITFDDGLRSSSHYADPLLEEFGFQAVMFVNTLMQEKEYPLYLSWKELDDLFHTGRWRMQAHGYLYHSPIIINPGKEEGDFASNRQWLEGEKRLETLAEVAARLKKDLLKQKEDIETHIPGEKVIAFAYPFGDIGENSQNLSNFLATALNDQAVNSVFPLSFGVVHFSLSQFTLTSTPHLIVRLMVSAAIQPEQLLEYFQKLPSLPEGLFSEATISEPVEELASKIDKREAPL